MSDLLAPILFVMQNEVDAFWCFVGYMDRVSGNFDFEAGGIKHQVLLQFGQGPRKEGVRHFVTKGHKAQGISA